MPVRAEHPSLIFCSDDIAFVKMMIWVSFVSLMGGGGGGGGSHCTVCVTASIYMVRLEMVILQTSLSSFYLIAYPPSLVLGDRTNCFGHDVKWFAATLAEHLYLCCSVCFFVCLFVCLFVCVFVLQLAVPADVCSGCPTMQSPCMA